MSEENAFCRAILAAPEDATTRLVYADWLEDRGDPRAKLLRQDQDVPRISFVDWIAEQGNLDYYMKGDPELRGRLNEHEANKQWRERLAVLGDAIDPHWLAVMDTLGRPFHPFFFFDNTGPRAFEADELPFREQIGLRGSIVTFESAFRGDRVLEPGLTSDLRFLLELRLWECEYGAARCPTHPFICEQPIDRSTLTGTDVLRALKAREFRSQHIRPLDARTIPYPGYHPGTANDEIHTDPSGQCIFPNPADMEPEEETDGANARAATHEALRGYVKRGQLWYVLLHSWIGPASDEMDRHGWVVLFAVGQSPHGNRLLGVVTHQVCHNFCD
jgi:uncharacterized protein (TIGR02996 family)